MFCHIELKLIQTAARHSISIAIFTAQTKKRQFRAIFQARNQDKTSFLHVFTTANNTKQMLAKTLSVLIKLKLKNYETCSRCCLHYRNCKWLCVNIVVTLQHDVTSEIKRNITNHFKNPHHSCEELRKKPQKINSKLPEFCLEFLKRMSCKLSSHNLSVMNIEYRRAHA